MTRVVSVVEKDIFPVPPSAPIVIAANTAQNVLPTIQGSKEETASRFVQNIGANSCNYSFGADCNGQEFHGQIPAGSQMNASSCGQRVSIYSLLGTTIVVSVFRRVDLYAHVNITPQVLP